MRTLILLGLCGLITACTEEESTPPATAGDVVGYAQLHAKVFVPACGTGPCHSGPRGISGLSFDDLDDSYDRLVGAMTGLSSHDPTRRRVSPGDPENSVLWLKLTADTDTLDAANLGAPMPMAGVEKPGPETLAHIEAWIRAGAPMEGADFEPDFVRPEGGYLECDASDEAGLIDCLEPPTPGAAIRLQSPPILVPPGSEVVVCAEVATLDADLLVRSIETQQMVGGHHLALFTAVAVRGTSTPVDCLDDMTNYRYVTAGDANGRVSLPAPQALAVKAGETLVLQSHYINTGVEPRWVMDTMDLIAPPEGAEVLLTDSLILNTTAINIPAGADEHEVVKTCRLEQDMRIELATGHTHEYGVWFDLEAIPANGPPIRLFHSTEGPVLRDFAGFFPVGLDLSAGDALRITCRWTNPTDAALRFPREMCAGVTYYTPGAGALLCDTEDETPRAWSEVVGGGGDGEGCVSPDAQGNTLGVGRFCTAGGTECADQEADFCLAAFDATANYCSIIFCEDDAQCGDGASCVSGDGGAACVPLMCQ